MDCDFIHLPTHSAIRIHVPSNMERQNLHMILLLDISESMQENQKLEHVKKCCEILLDFLTPQDHLSLITFGDESKTLLNHIAVDTAQKEHCRTTIQSLKTDGCTNLSAGLNNVFPILEEHKEKATLLLLTDGIANRGIRSSTGLLQIIHQIAEKSVSIQCVGYGTDHNADLLREISEEAQGSYNIVKSIEDTATAFGDTLGGFMSCVAHNVSLRVPLGTTSPSKILSKETHMEIPIGDVYSGTKPIVLFTLPVDTTNVELSGLMADGTRFKLPASWINREKDVDIELCRLRHVCSQILKKVRNENQNISTLLEEFERDLADPSLEGLPMTIHLKKELELIHQLRNTHISNNDYSLLTQHSAVLNLGRGFTSPLRREEDPITFQNETQANFSALLRLRTREQ